MRTLRIVLAVSGLFLPLLWAGSSVPNEGANLYLKGILSSGAEVTGTRGGGGSSSGEAVACVNCHRQSGMGTVEGDTVVPPITGRYLFKPGALFGREANYAERMTATRVPYTDATLAKAIREGVDPNGRTLDYLMPRYKLDDATMSSLIAYLKGLSSAQVPGVEIDTLHFATIITPDADPVKRKGMLDVLQHFVTAKNVFYRPIPAPVRYTKMMYHVPHKWQLQVWELSGEPETWGDQLRKRYKEEPVFAVISGLGGRNWGPIHQFCQQESIPCLFPNVEVPIVAEGDFYNIYFSRGVLLEAQLIAQQIQNSATGSGIHRVVQIFRDGDVGVDAAKALHEDIAPQGLTTIERSLSPHASEAELEEALKKAGAKDALVLWLRPGDLQNLPSEPPKGTKVFLSGIMGGLDDVPIKGEWRSAARMSYPFEVPSRRGVLLDYPLGWIRFQHIQLVAPETQVETYIACNIVSESLNGMLDNFLRDYLVENVEAMLSTRIIDGYYTRLGLAPGQRFASKGGYIVHFAGVGGKNLVPDGDWMVP